MAATDRSFSAMLNEYLTYPLLKEELVKRDYMLNKIEKDNGWKGGNLVVPFKGAGASSISYGGLTASNDIAEDTYVRGGVSTYKEAWGAMVFNHKDLVEHDAISEQNFLKVLPGSIDDFMSRFKVAVSCNLLNGPYISKVAGTGTSGGLIAVNFPDRYDIGQKVYFQGTTAPLVFGYISAINMNSDETTSMIGQLTVVTARGGSTALNLSAYTVADAGKVYYEGAVSNSFSSLRDALLSSANGGSSTLYGQTKTAYPYLQAIQVQGSTWDATNFLSKLFDAYVISRQKGKGNPNEALMSYRNLGTVMKLIELSKGAYKVSPTTEKASLYGWTEIEVVGVRGTLKVVGIQEMEEDVIHMIDWRALKFHSNGFFKKRQSPDGKEYYEVRAQTGYKYIVDLMLFGELVVSRPSYCGIVHGISY